MKLINERNYNGSTNRELMSNINVDVCMRHIELKTD